MPTFAQPTQDRNLTPGWNVQGTGAAGSPGPGDPGYGEPATVQAPLNVIGNQLGAGAAFPAGAEDVGAETAQATQILVNPGYGGATGPVHGTLPQTIAGTTYTAPSAPSSGAVAVNPSSSNVAYVTLSAATGLTAVKVGGVGATFAQATQVGTTVGTYAVPPGGVIGGTFTSVTFAWSI